MHRKARSSFLALTLLTACGGGGNLPPGPIPVPVPGTVYGTFATAQSLPTWNEYIQQNKLVVQDQDIDDPNKKSTVDTAADGSYSCTTTPRSLATTPRSIVALNPGGSALWLGGLLQGRGYASIGELQEFPIRKRAPFKIYIDLLSQGVSETVETPDAASVQEAIGKLVSTAMQRGAKGASNTFGSKTQVSDVKSSLLRLGISARYGNVNASALLATEKRDNQNRLTAYFMETLFTVNMVRPESSDAFFKGITEADLKAQLNAGNLGKDNLPVYVASVTYGRILMFTITSSEKTDRLQFALDATYSALNNKAKVFIDGEVKRILSNSQLDVTTFGGDDAAARRLFASGDLSQYLLTDTALNQYRPVSYTVRDMATDQLVAVSETTSYNQRICGQNHDEKPLPKHEGDPRFFAFCETARTHSGIREACDSEIKTYNAPPGYYIVPNNQGYNQYLGFGDEHDCRINFINIAGFPDGEHPTSVTLQAHARSPSNSTQYGAAFCELDGKIVRP